MKNKKSIYIISAIVLLVIVGIIIVFFTNHKDVDDSKIAEGLTKLNLKSGVKYPIDLNHSKVFDNYTSFSYYFNDDNIVVKDFENNNYAVIVLTYDECNYTNVIPTEYNIKGNNINITAYHDGCSTCEPLYEYFAVKVDKKITELNQYTKMIARTKKGCQ